MVNRTVRWVVAPNLNGRESLLLFSSCDSGYLAYAVSLIRSVDVFSPGATFFLHVINPDPQTLARVYDLQKRLQFTKLAVSFEEIDLSPLTLDQRRAYYASARFLQVSKILAFYSVPVFSLDADSLMVNPVDSNFTDKTDADIVIVRRNLTEDQPDHLAIATGSIWFSPTLPVIQFLEDVAVQIDQGIMDQTLEWFIDQRLFYLQMKACEEQVRVYNLKRKYADWKFSTSSILWAGKGGLKLYDLRFFLLQNLLGDDPAKRNIAHHLADEFFTLDDAGEDDWFLGRIRRALGGGNTEAIGLIDAQQALVSEAPAVDRTTQRVAVFIPRLDLPWGRQHSAAKQFPIVGDDILDLRLRWKEFAVRLSNALEHAGVRVELIELPAWEIERERIDAGGYALAFVPHRCSLNMVGGKTPVLFYMQEFFRWVFVVDRCGWSAASSVYPVSRDIASHRTATSFQEYRERLSVGQLASKFSQQVSKPVKQLLEDGALPFEVKGRFFKRRILRPYIFFPLQVPTDQSIMLFSEYTEKLIVEALVEWAKAHDVVVVMKPHPANMKSMAPFESLVDNTHIFFSHANVKDLIQHSVAVYTINSGVGFEAILQNKPVVTFGRVEYDCATFNASPDGLDEAWKYACSVPQDELVRRYANFVNWFLECYAVDMSQPEFASARFKEIVSDVISIIEAGSGELQ